MKKKMIMLAVLTFAFLTGCSNKSPDTDDGQSAENTGASYDMEITTEYALPEIDTNIENEEMKNRRKFSAEDNLRVVLIGNSLMMSNDIEGNLKTMAKIYGYQIDVYSLSGYGATIADSISKFDNENVLKVMQDADVVVFQEYGGYYENTYNDIKRVLKYCSDDVEAYYFTTEFDYDDRLFGELAEDEKIHLVPSNALISYVTNRGYYTYEELRLEEDYHPNEMNGCIVSLLLFAEITGQKCLDFPGAYTNNSLLNVMPGDTIGDRISTFREIYEAADKMLDVYEVKWKEFMLY